MLVHTNEHLPLARLLQFIELGEQVAHICSKAQTFIAPDPGMQRFLNEQARQESFHAMAFHTAIDWIAPKHLGPSPFSKPFTQYRQLIESALGRGDFYETIVAEQVILEGLGEVTLKKLERGLIKRQAPFQRLRRIFLHQEEAHHGFGNRVLERALLRQDISLDDLRERAQNYITVAETMITTGQDMLIEITEDSDWYLTEFHKTLPDWMHYSPSRAVA